MLQPQRVNYQPQTIVDYVNPHGPTAKEVRAIVLQGAIAQLKVAGHYDDYMAHCSVDYADTVKLALAGSWLPIEMIVTHHETLERIALSDAQISSMAERLGANIFDQLFATIIRAIRTAGAGDGVWFGFKQADRVMSRMYNGGACRVTKTGPKDALYELRGLPGVNLRPSRVSQCAFFRGVMSLTTKACVVKVVPSPEPGPFNLALAISWV